MTKVAKPKVILLDIEGTLCDGHFLHNLIFPFIRANVDKFLEATFDSSETQLVVGNLRALSKSGTHQGMPTIAVGDKRSVIPSAVKNILWQMKHHTNSMEIRSVWLLCWQWGAESDQLKIHVYDDVSKCLHKWKTSGIRLFTYSAGLAIAQKLLFAKTTHGNLYPLIDNFFDNSLGDKTDAKSYQTIADKVGCAAKQMLFITDSAKEAKAAVKANYTAVVIKRPDSKSNEETDLPKITSFSDIKF